MKDNSVWFQYQEEALVRLTVDDSGRTDQQTFPLPDIGKRVMHRIAQGPDGNMWFTSLAADVVSRLVTDQQGLPVYSFDQKHTGDQYLSESISWGRGHCNVAFQGPIDRTDGPDNRW